MSTENYLNETDVYNPYWWEGLRRLDMPAILLGPEGIVLDLNKEAKNKLGYSTKELRYRSILDITHKEDRVSEVNNYLDIFYSTKLISITTKRFVTAQSKVLKFKQAISVIEDPETETRYAILILKEFEDERILEDSSEAEEAIASLINLTEMFNLDEFGSVYNKDIIAQFKTKLNALAELIMSEKRAA